MEKKEQTREKKCKMEEEVERVFRGTVIHSLDSATLQVLPQAWLGVNKAGRVAFLHPSELALLDLKSMCVSFCMSD